MALRVLVCIHDNLWKVICSHPVHVRTWVRPLSTHILGTDKYDLWSSACPCPALLSFQYDHLISSAHLLPAPSLVPPAYKSRLSLKRFAASSMSRSMFSARSDPGWIPAFWFHPDPFHLPGLWETLWSWANFELTFTCLFSELWQVSGVGANEARRWLALPPFIRLMWEFSYGGREIFKGELLLTSGIKYD